LKAKERREHEHDRLVQVFYSDHGGFESLEM
jgi:hypothetical protein